MYFRIKHSARYTTIVQYQLLYHHHCTVPVAIPPPLYSTSCYTTTIVQYLLLYHHHCTVPVAIPPPLYSTSCYTTTMGIVRVHSGHGTQNICQFYKKDVLQLSEHGGVIEMRTLKVCHLKAVHQTQSMCPRKHS